MHQLLGIVCYVINSIMEMKYHLLILTLIKFYIFISTYNETKLLHYMWVYIQFSWEGQGLKVESKYILQTSNIDKSNIIVGCSNITEKSIQSKSNKLLVIVMWCEQNYNCYLENRWVEYIQEQLVLTQQEPPLMTKCNSELNFIHVNVKLQSLLVWVLKSVLYRWFRMK